MKITISCFFLFFFLVSFRFVCFYRSAHHIHKIIVSVTPFSSSASHFRVYMRCTYTSSSSSSSMLLILQFNKWKLIYFIFHFYSLCTVLYAYDKISRIDLCLCVCIVRGRINKSGKNEIRKDLFGNPVALPDSPFLKRNSPHRRQIRNCYE